MTPLLPTHVARCTKGRRCAVLCHGNLKELSLKLPHKLCKLDLVLVVTLLIFHLNELLQSVHLSGLG